MRDGGVNPPVRENFGAVPRGGVGRGEGTVEKPGRIHGAGARENREGVGAFDRYHLLDFSRKSVLVGYSL